LELSFLKRSPLLPLINPERDRREQSSIPFFYGASVLNCEREKRILNVWGKQSQVHNLCQSRPRDITQASEIGVISDFATVDHLLELNRESH